MILIQPLGGSQTALFLNNDGYLDGMAFQDKPSEVPERDAMLWAWIKPRYDRYSSELTHDGKTPSIIGTRYYTKLIATLDDLVIMYKQQPLISRCLALTPEDCLLIAKLLQHSPNEDWDGLVYAAVSEKRVEELKGLFFHLSNLDDITIMH